VWPQPCPSTSSCCRRFRHFGQRTQRIPPEIRAYASVQKCQTTPPPAKTLCWRLLSVCTLTRGTPDQKSRPSPRRLNLWKIFTSSPKPAWSTPVFVPVGPGLCPPKSRVELSEKWPNRRSATRCRHYLPECLCQSRRTGARA
jgi:hypothetical protein